MPRATTVRFAIDDASGSRVVETQSDNDGRCSVTDAAGDVGTGQAVVSALRKRGFRNLATCTYSVIAPPVCGDGSCDANEDCGSCDVDCGACPTCGDGSCDANEDCASCESDCGICGPICGDGTCDPAEDCSNCEADCGICGPICGDGTCDPAEDCSNCESDCGACPSCDPVVTSYGSGRHKAGAACGKCHSGFKVAGTLYDDASGSNAVAGATIHIVDANGDDYALTSMANGNFYTTNSNIRFPVLVVASSCPNTVEKVEAIGSGDCNSCHDSSFRIHLP